MKKLINYLFPHKQYWVFRRYRRIMTIEKPNSIITEESFALHFVEPFSNKKEANEAIKNAQNIDPWQKFIILRS